ncbi:MAG: hypothetical protein A3H93_07470 [Rhodocyclales bacterium RIFCSPLOWO2_02_FULL_63_24]|nr:MAG: hypothetical protein A2040_04130 [Rhodocyclales bacterium GWA2_65_19]OHC69222.1 MAG: hypothetical protein A3H93_07470 [Rhodocyclales bacterium RIFCSPLOWO2_02_FULL_63_24]
MNDSVAVPPAPTFPKVRQIDFAAPLRWLGLGWQDLWRQPPASLFYGLAIAVAGAVILGVTANLPYLFAAAITGFLLVAPMLAAGLYELSRRYLAKEPAPLVESMLAWKRNPSGLVGFGLLSILAGTLWQGISALIVVLFYKGATLSPLAMMIEVLINPQHFFMFFTYICVGGVLAALVFTLSVVSMPMLVDRRCDLICALGTSINAVAENPLPLAFWAFLIMLLTALGFATALLGLIVVMPWLGHASFHAYKDLVE